MGRSAHRHGQTCPICGKRFTCTTWAIRRIDRDTGELIRVHEMPREYRRPGDRIRIVETDVHRLAHVRAGDVKPDDPRVQYHNGPGRSDTNWTEHVNGW